MKVHDGWQGGKFSADQAPALRQMAAACSLWGMSEVLHLPPPAGHAAYGDESQVFWDTRVWVRVTAETAVLHTPPWKRGTDERETVDVHLVLLKHHQTGLRYARGVFHFPALHGLRTQTAANQAALDRLAPEVKPILRDWKPDATHLSGDTNRRLDTTHGRHLLRDALDPLGMQLLIPPKATHGVRAKIDCSAMAGHDLALLDMVDRVRLFDHRGYEVTAAVCPECAA